MVDSTNHDHTVTVLPLLELLVVLPPLLTQPATSVAQDSADAANAQRSLIEPPVSTIPNSTFGRL
jgi:hypothetical protein